MLDKNIEFNYRRSTYKISLINTSVLIGLTTKEKNILGYWFSMCTYRKTKDENYKIDKKAIYFGTRAFLTVLKRIRDFENIISVTPIPNIKGISFLCTDKEKNKLLIEFDVGFMVNENASIPTIRVISDHSIVYKEICITPDLFIDEYYYDVDYYPFDDEQECKRRFKEAYKEVNDVENHNNFASENTKISNDTCQVDTSDTSNMVKLSIPEIISYWWINVIKLKIEELLTIGTSTDDEFLFLSIFKNYTEVNWHQLYLEFSKQINIYLIINKKFKQGTPKKEHEYIRDGLSKILQTHIPDIDLSSYENTETMVYTENDIEIIKDDNIREKVGLYHEKNYIVTGNQEELHFYYLLVSTIYLINIKNKTFNSIPVLKKVFLSIYRTQSNLTSESTEHMFNKNWNMLVKKDIISGLSCNLTYEAHFNDLQREKIYLEMYPYLNLANEYANNVLNYSKDNNNSHKLNF